MKNFKTRTKLVFLAALVLAALVCLSSCGSSSKAADASGKIEGTDIEWKYTSSDSTLEVSGKGEIPSYSSAGDAPWAGVITSAEEIEIEDGIVAIGDRAFFGATAAEKIVIPDSVTAIGNYAFAHASALKEIELPLALKTLGNGAFEACSSLKSISVGESLTSLGERAFAFCNSLESASILSPVEIKAETFYNCTKLDSVVLHAGISAEKVSADAFKGAAADFDDAQIAADPDKTVTVTIKYVDADKKELADSVVITKKIGESYTQNSPEIEGYTADKLTVSGSIPAEDEEIIVTYTKQEEETTEEATTEEAAADTDDEDPNYVALIIMVVVLVGVGVGAYFLIKSDKKNAEKAKNQNKAKNRKQK